MEEQMDFKDLTVKAYTTPSPICVNQNVLMPTLMNLMREHNIRHLPVINEKEEAIGIISDRDITTVKAIGSFDNLKAIDLMSEDPISVIKNMNLLDAVFEMAQNKVGSLIINDERGKVYGIFTNTDALNALIEVLKGEILENE